MFKKMCCQLDIDLSIVPVDPILIKSGYASVSGPDMSFVRTYRNGKGKPEVFLPGSSLKGVLRSHAERIIRTLSDGNVCMPYMTRRNCGDSEAARRAISCSDHFDQYKRKLNKLPTNEDAYRWSCPACRLFGSMWFGGRLSISDAYSQGDAPNPEPRDGVAIDRFTGGAASKAKFELEVVTRGRFGARLTVRNFELWQLGLIAYIMQDLEDEIIHIGTGKSRGLGRVRGEIGAINLTYYKEVDGLKGVESFISNDEREAYGIATYDPMPDFALADGVRSGVRWVYDVTDRKNDLYASAEPCFNTYLQSVSWYNAMMRFIGE